jgi:hypothetical protein
MPNFNQKRFCRPETFRRIQPELLVSWLRRYDTYFIKRGLFLPGGHLTPSLSPCGEGDGSGLAVREADGGDLTPALSTGGGEGDSIDYDGLVRVVMEPTPDMPSELVDSLHLVEAMGTSRQLDRMLDEARSNGLNLGLDEFATPEDVAIKLWLLDPHALENLHNSGEVTRPRAFEYFTTDETPVPAFPDPTLDQLRALERRLDQFYVAWRRGDGTRVFAYCQQRIWQEWPEWLFLVRHGAPFRREEAMENGQPTSVLYRPRKYAVLKYDTGRGEMGVYCSGAREQRVLLRALGTCLFGRADFFPGRAKFNLHPLVKLGRASLAFADVPGIEDVRLTDVEFYKRKSPWRRVTQHSADIFSLLEQAEMSWPRELDEITKATFAVKLCRQKRARRVTIVPCNRALYCRDDFSEILERWMEARTFISPKRK